MSRHKNRDWQMSYDDMIQACSKITLFTEGYNFEKFMDDAKTIDSVILNIAILGEAIKNIPDNIVSQIPDIPWVDITDTRNRLIHEYFGTDLEFIWEVIQKHIPELKIQLEQYKKEHSALFVE